MNKWQPGQALKVLTKNYVLRSLTVEDATDTYISWWNDAEVQQGFNELARGWDQARAIKHISSFNNRDKFHLGIFAKDSGILIGFFAMFVNHRHKVVKSNVCVGDKSMWGKDVGVEVRAAMLEFIFGPLAMEKVCGEVYGRNLPSFYTYKVLGFRLEGVLKNQLDGIGGGRIAIYHFGLSKEEWEQNRKTGSFNAGRSEDLVGNE
jgi:RimJ/RimL family protein N-acetyltransferase